MRVKMILPDVAKAHSPFWRPIKYSLFPPLGIVTLAGHFSKEEQIELIEKHVAFCYKSIINSNTNYRQ
ncbi:MAG: hypothetical protein HYV28_20985 [Ignavibacteriales bacterium]|nr:hypothetical protein [Ignavibacteriales bacterium]